MKKINKTNPPRSFISMMTHNKPSNWEDFHKQCQDVFNDCVDSLKVEQGNLDGYTEKPLGKNRHIDHFIKQKLDTNKVFDWNNLILAEYVDDKSYGANAKDERINNVDSYKSLINPVEEDASRYFDYMENGQIIPRRTLTKEEKEKAIFTIETFQLQNESLLHIREQIIRQAKECINGKIAAHDIRVCFKDSGFPSCVEYVLNI